MAIDKTVYTDKLIQIQKIKAQIEDLSRTRTQDEEALNITYQVNTCNQAKKTLTETYQTQFSILNNQLKSLQDELNNIVMER